MESRMESRMQAPFQPPIRDVQVTDPWIRKFLADIWNMRTWGWATVPHWTDADKRRYLDSRLCPACRRRGEQNNKGRILLM